MPNTQSAKKRLRQNVKRRLRNQMRRTRCKSSRKAFLAAVEQQDVAAAEEALRVCTSVFDKAAKKHAISKAKADRNKARLMRKLSAIKTTEGATA